MENSLHRSERAFNTIKIPPPAETFTIPANLLKVWDPFKKSFSPYICYETLLGIIYIRARSENNSGYFLSFTLTG
jgi:hypothetical protein